MTTLKKAMGQEKVLTEKEKGIQQLTLRMHVNDHKLIKKMLIDDNLKFQAFFDACVQSYFRRDPSIMKVIQDYKDLNIINRKEKKSFTFSNREKHNLLDEIESE